MRASAKYLTTSVFLLYILLAKWQTLYAREIERIEVFTTSNSPVHLNTGTLQVPNMQIRYYELDLWLKLEQHYSVSMAMSPMSYALKRAQWLSTGYAEHLKNSYSGLVIAQAYGLSVYPAIVINRESILYGLTNVQAAISLYRKHHGTNDRRYMPFK